MPPNDAARYRWTFAAFGIVWVTLVWPWASGHVTIPWDAKAHFYPQLLFLSHALHAGDSPFWNPYVFAGHPQIADPQSLIFSPPFLALAAMVRNPTFAMADTVLLATLGVGGLALVLFARDEGWHPAAGLTAGLAFVFGGSAAWRVQHVGQILSLSFLAITWWLLARALKRQSVLYGALAGLAGGCMVLGRDQVAWLGVLVLAGFALWHVAGMGRSCLAALKPLLAGLTIGALIVAVPLALTYDLAQMSNRTEIDYAGAARGSLHPASLLTLLIPNLFGTDGPLAQFWGPPSLIWGPTDLFLARNMGDVYFGALPLLALAVLLVSGVAWRERTIAFLLLMLAFLLAYALGRYTPLFRLLFDLPGASLFRRPADATFPIGFILALLGGYGVHIVCSPNILVPGVRRIMAVLLIVAAAFGSAIWLAAQTGTLGLALPNIRQALAFAALAAGTLLLMRRWPNFAVPLVALSLALDLAANNGPNESTALPPGNFSSLQPGTNDSTIAWLRQHVVDDATLRDRVELTAIDFHWPNAGMVQGLEHTLGYNPVRLSWFTQATAAGDHVAVPDQRQFSALFAHYRSPLADMLGLKFIATGVPIDQIDKGFLPGDLALAGRTKDAYIYENTRALPRVVFADTAVSADFARLMQSGAWPAVDFAHTVLLEGFDPETKNPLAAQPGAANIVSYANTEVLMEVDAPAAGWVVLFDTWHPAWMAEVDGLPQPVLRADVIFRAVAVSVGHHTVRLRFQPLEALKRQWLTYVTLR